MLQRLAISTQRIRDERIVVKLTFAAHGYQTRFSQDFQVLRAGRLLDGKLLGQITTTLFTTRGNGLQNIKTRPV